MLVNTLFSNITFLLRPIWLQSLVAIDSESCHTSFPSFCAAICNHCAVWFESEQTPNDRAGRWFGSTALHRIRFRTCCFVPMPYFYSESNEWSKDWAKQWALHWSATPYHQFHRKLHFTWKQKVTRHGPKFKKHSILFHSQTDSVSQEWKHVFLKRACRGQQRLPPTWKRPVFVLARQTSPSIAGTLPTPLGHGFCSKNLRLSSRITLGSDCQMTSRGLNLDSTWTLPPDQRIVEVLSALKPIIICVEFEFFWGLSQTPKLRTAASPYQSSVIPHPPDLNMPNFVKN